MKKTRVMEKVEVASMGHESEREEVGGPTRGQSMDHDPGGGSTIVPILDPSRTTRLKSRGR